MYFHGADASAASEQGKEIDQREAQKSQAHCPGGKREGKGVSLPEQG